MAFNQWCPLHAHQRLFNFYSISLMEHIYRCIGWWSSFRLYEIIEPKNAQSLIWKLAIKQLVFSDLKAGRCRQNVVIRLSLSFFLSLFPDRNFAPPHKWLCHGPSLADASSLIKHYRVIMVGDTPWVVKRNHKLRGEHRGPLDSA